MPIKIMVHVNGPFEKNLGIQLAIKGGCL